MHVFNSLPGKSSDSSLGTCREAVSSSSKTIDKVINGLPRGGTGLATVSSSLQLPCLETVMAARDELQSALQALSTAFNTQGLEEKRGSSGSEKSTRERGQGKEGTLVASDMGRNRGAPKIVSLSSGLSLSNGDAHWV